jgi:5'-AMP-activated protein kinase regulatory beta subunit
MHGGTEVFVTGSFNSWGGKFVMQRVDDGEFSLILDLPPGSHAYRYVVDQEWKVDEDAPTVTIAGETNNVIEVKRPVFEYPPANYADSDDDDADERKQRTAYAQVMPQVDDYVKEPIKLPPQLTTIILQQEQQTEGQLLPVPEHVVLNHLYVLPSVDRELLITGITQRFKPNSHTRITHKFVTTVFYQPMPHGEVGGEMGLGPGVGSVNRVAVQPYQQGYSGYDAGHLMNGAMSG